MSISLNIKISSAKTFRLFRINLISFALILINTSVNYNTKINLIEFFQFLCLSNLLFNNNTNLSYNVNNSFVFNVEIIS